jgi:hypothetical protein
MRKLLLLTTAAALTLTLSGPSFGAPRVQHGQNSSTVYNPSYSSGSPNDAYARGNGQYGYTGGNLPYPDRPWGAPDRD